MEEIAYIPIICISNYHIDKKIKELIKVCDSFEFHSPTNAQIQKIIQITMPLLFDNKSTLLNIVNYIQNDLRKLTTISKIYKNKPNNT